MSEDENALDRLQEAPDIEFKESASWDSLRWKIIRRRWRWAIMQDGGILVVGVSQRAGQVPLTGISETDLETYDPDIAADQFGRFISPDMEFILVQVPYRQNTYLAFEFREFREIPLECAGGMERGRRPEWCTSGHVRGARAARKPLMPRRCGSFLT